MLSEPEAALAAVMASRRVHSVESQMPSPGSAVEFTVKVTPVSADAPEVSGLPAPAKAVSGALLEAEFRSRATSRIKDWCW